MITIYDRLEVWTRKGSAKSCSLVYEEKQWNTIVVQWSYDDNNPNLPGYVYFLDECYKLIWDGPSDEEKSLYIGSDVGGKKAFSGCIAAIEMYNLVNERGQLPRAVIDNMIGWHNSLVNTKY